MRKVANTLTWWLIEIVVVVFFLYIVAFLSASIGMMVVERDNSNEVDTTHEVPSKRYDVKPIRTK